MIFARRSRSASACRAIARCMLAGISTSFTSTAETLMPHGPVASSMISCRIALIFSRSESSSSSTCWPSTDRSVVCAFCEVATMKFSTCTIASFGATMRKYATALTRTGTLSFVITSCGGMFSVIVRRSTFTMRSTTGMSRKSPGPFGSGNNRPRRKTMPRSYSRATLIAEIRKRMTRKRTTARATSPAAMTELSHRQLEAVDTFDLYVVAGDESGPVRAVRLPELSVDEDLAGAAHDGLGADDARRLHEGRPSPNLHRLPHRYGPEEAERDRHSKRQPHGGVIWRRRVVEEQEHSHGEADEPGDRERAVCHHVRVDHKERDPEQDQQEPDPGDRQHGEAEERRQKRDSAERAGEDDARMEDLEADADDPGEEQQPEDVRVDERVQDAREEPRFRVVDVRAGEVQHVRALGVL